MCAEGMVGGAILAKAMEQWLQPFQMHNANQISNQLLVRRGSLKDIQCAPALSGGIRIQ